MTLPAPRTLRGRIADILRWGSEPGNRRDAVEQLAAMVRDAEVATLDRAISTCETVYEQQCRVSFVHPHGARACVQALQQLYPPGGQMIDPRDHNTRTVAGTMTMIQCQRCRRAHSAFVQVCPACGHIRHPKPPEGK